jgi:hypothetical protein
MWGGESFIRRQLIHSGAVLFFAIIYTLIALFSISSKDGSTWIRGFTLGLFYALRGLTMVCIYTSTSFFASYLKQGRYVVATCVCCGIMIALFTAGEGLMPKGKGCWDNTENDDHSQQGIILLVAGLTLFYMFYAAAPFLLDKRKMGSAYYIIGWRCPLQFSDSSNNWHACFAT